MACNCCECVERCPSISLEEWREAMSFNPYYFWQQAQDPNTYTDTVIPIDPFSTCSEIVYNLGLLGGSSAGRLEAWNAIKIAEEAFHDFTGYWPGPTQGCDEFSFNPYRGGKLRLRSGKLIQLGKEVTTELVTVPVATSDITDEAGDGVPDTVTVFTPDDGNGVTGLHIHFSEDVWLNSDRCYHEIQPAEFTTDGTTITITFPSWIFIRPTLYRGFNQGPVDPSDPAVYATEIVLSRVTVDEDQAVEVCYREDPGCSCQPVVECCTCAPRSACIVNASIGLIEILPEALENCGCPKCIERVCVHYVSGECDNLWLARLAAAYLGREICCKTNSEIDYWQEDYVGVDGSGRIVTPLMESERANPFGTRRGHVETFRFYRKKRIRKLYWI